MARTFSGTADATGTNNVITGGKVRAIYVKNTGTNDLEVNVPAAHGTEYDIINPGDTGTYETYGSPTADHITEFNVRSTLGTTWIAGVTKAEV